MRKDWYNLCWLPVPEGDFSEQCAKIPADPTGALRDLSSHRLTESQLRKIAGICAKIVKVPQGFETFNLTVLSDANCEFLVSCLKASALRYDLWLDVNIEPMGSLATAALDPASTLYQTGPDAILIACTYHSFVATHPLGNATESQRAVGDFLSNIKHYPGYRKGKVRGKNNCPNDTPRARVSFWAALMRVSPARANFQIESFNSEIAAEFGGYDRCCATRKHHRSV